MSSLEASSIIAAPATALRPCFIKSTFSPPPPSVLATKSGRPARQINKSSGKFMAHDKTAAEPYIIRSLPWKLATTMPLAQRLFHKINKKIVINIHGCISNRDIHSLGYFTNVRLFTGEQGHEL